MRRRHSGKSEDVRDGDPSGSESSSDSSVDAGLGEGDGSSPQPDEGVGGAPTNAVYPGGRHRELGNRRRKSGADPQSGASSSSGDAGSFPSNYIGWRPITRCR